MNYLKINRSKLCNLDKSYQYELLHLSIHVLLNHFINLEFLHPREKLKVSLSNKFKINNLGITRLREVIDFYNCLTGKEYKINWEEQRNPISFFKTLVNLNNVICSNIEKLKELKEEVVTSEIFKKDKYLSLPIVIDFYKEVSKINGIKDIFIQGSLATLDYTKFSDFDTFIILDKQLEENPEGVLDTIYNLLKSSIYLYKFDPYQHHRYFVTLESNLNTYNQSFLPTEVLRYAVSFKKGTYRFKVYDSHLSHLAYIIGSINYLVKHINSKFVYIKNLWHLKYFIGIVFFLPVLFLEVEGIYVYKRESFKLIKDYLPQDLNEYLDYCSSLRDNWNYSLNLREKFFMKLALNYFYRNSILFEYLMRNFSQNFEESIYEKVFEGSIPYTRFFYERILEELDKKELL